MRRKARSQRNKERLATQVRTSADRRRAAVDAAAPARGRPPPDPHRFAAFQRDGGVWLVAGDVRGDVKSRALPCQIHRPSNCLSFSQPVPSQGIGAPKERKTSGIRLKPVRAVPICRYGKRPPARQHQKTKKARPANGGRAVEGKAPQKKAPLGCGVGLGSQKAGQRRSGNFSCLMAPAGPWELAFLFWRRGLFFTRKRTGPW